MKKEEKKKNNKKEKNEEITRISTTLPINYLKKLTASVLE